MWDCDQERASRVVAALLLALTLTLPVFAHHSQTQFDLTKTVTLQGTVTEVDWSNPHTFFYLQGSDIGVPDSPKRNWGLEGQSPSFLMRNGEGWTADTIKVGDKITATGNARKDGKPEMLLLELTAADGKHYTSKSPFPAKTN